MARTHKILEGRWKLVILFHLFGGKVTAGAQWRTERVSWSSARFSNRPTAGY
jgi:hypothetical protein